MCMCVYMCRVGGCGYVTYYYPPLSRVHLCTDVKRKTLKSNTWSLPSMRDKVYIYKSSHLMNHTFTSYTSLQDTHVHVLHLSYRGSLLSTAEGGPFFLSFMCVQINEDEIENTGHMDFGSSVGR